MAKKSKDLVEVGLFVKCRSVMDKKIKGQIETINQNTVIVFDGYERHLVTKKQLKELGYLIPSKRKNK